MPCVYMTFVGSSLLPSAIIIRVATFTNPPSYNGNQVLSSSLPNDPGPLAWSGACQGSPALLCMIYVGTLHGSRRPTYRYVLTQVHGRIGLT